MVHVLDNPAWNALTSGNSNLSFGTKQVKYFDREVSPFAAFKEISQEHFQTLYELIPDGRVFLFISAVEMEIPNPWKVLNCIKGLQMTCEALIEQSGPSLKSVSLTEEHVPQMLALTRLTNPGPFASRTIDFGHYQGIFDRNKLVAMAGQRLHVFNYAEISAVCTLPDYLGRGYAKQLVFHQINRIKAASEIPFLHVRHDNERAIRVYRSLGFSTRKEIYFYVIQKSR